MHTLIIGNKNYSSWSMRPWVAMTHFNIAFTEQQIWLFEDNWKADILALGCHTVPVLISPTSTGTQVLGDSLAILETLAEDHPGMWPRDTHKRAKAREACAHMHSGFMAMRSEMHMNCKAEQRQLSVSAECLADITKLEALWQSCFAMADNDAGYLFGDFCIADAFFAPVAVRFKGYQVALQPSSQAYVERLLSTPAVATWVQAGQAETRVLAQEEVGH